MYDLLSNFNGKYMNKTNLISLAIIAFFGASVAHAQSQNQVGSEHSFYGELGFSQVDLSGAGGDSKPIALRFLVGNEINKNLGLDILYTQTVYKDSKTGFDASYNGLGVFLKPKYSVIQGTEVFARIGVVRADITASMLGSSQGSDIAYGLGIQTEFTTSVYGQIDYMHSYDRDNVAAKGFTVSVGSHF